MSDLSDLSELRRLAEAATQGNWVCDGDNVYHERLDQAGRHIACAYVSYRTDREIEANAAFIVAFNPVVALDLISSLESERRGKEGMRKAIEAAISSSPMPSVAADDLRANWSSFCDADAFAGSDTFADRMEASGLIELVPVDEADLEECFAYERGIEPGGMKWVLTAEGRAALSLSPALSAGAGEEPVAWIAEDDLERFNPKRNRSGLAQLASREAGDPLRYCTVPLYAAPPAMAEENAALREAAQNAKGLLDTPISRRRNRDNAMYEEVLASLRAVLNRGGK